MWCAESSSCQFLSRVWRVVHHHCFTPFWWGWVVVTIRFNPSSLQSLLSRSWWEGGSSWVCIVVLPIIAIFLLRRCHSNNVQFNVGWWGIVVAIHQALSKLDQSCSLYIHISPWSSVWWILHTGLTTPTNVVEDPKYQNYYSPSLMPVNWFLKMVSRLTGMPPTVSYRWACLHRELSELRNPIFVNRIIFLVRIDVT